MDHLAHCDGLEEEITLFAAILRDSDGGRPVPTCPGWSVLDLAEHLGHVHRWSEFLVHNLADRRIAAGELPADRGPADPTWIRDGGARLLATLRRTDPNLAMWAWGADQHVRFWARRQHHETLVHRIDIQLATDGRPHVDDETAADAIDEFLVNLPAAATFSPRIDELKRAGGRLALRDSSTARRWVVRSDPSGARLTHDDGRVDVEFTVSGIDLLLSLYRRRSLDDVDGIVDGDEALLRFWLDRSALD